MQPLLMSALVFLSMYPPENVTQVSRGSDCASQGDEGEQGLQNKAQMSPLYDKGISTYFPL